MKMCILNMYNLFYVNYTFKKLYLKKKKTEQVTWKWLKDQGWRLWSDRDLHHDKGWKRSQEATEGEGVKGLMGSYGCHEGKGLRESKAVKKEK